MEERWKNRNFLQHSPPVTGYDIHLSPKTGRSSQSILCSNVMTQPQAFQSWDKQSTWSVSFSTQEGEETDIEQLKNKHCGAYHRWEDRQLLEQQAEHIHGAAIKVPSINKLINITPSDTDRRCQLSCFIFCCVISSALQKIHCLPSQQPGFSFQDMKVKIAMFMLRKLKLRSICFNHQGTYFYYKTYKLPFFFLFTHPNRKISIQEITLPVIQHNWAWNFKSYYYLYSSSKLKLLHCHFENIGKTTWQILEK